MSTADNKKIAKNTLFMYTRMGVTILIGFYTSRVVLEQLGVTDYGIYNAVGGIVALFTILNGAMTEATQRFISFDLGKGDMRKLNRTFSMCLNVHILISILIVLFSEPVGLWLLYHKMVIPVDRLPVAFWVFQLSVLASVVSVIQVPYSSCLSAHERFNVYAGFQIMRSILLLIFVFSLQFVDRDKLLAYAIFVFFANLSIAFGNIVYDLRNFEECIYTWFWDKSLFKNISGYTTWSLVGNLSNTLSDQGINILLNMFFGPVINAARGIAIQVQGAVASLVTNFQGVSVPQIVKLYAEGEKEESYKLVNNSSKISFFLFYLMIVPVCIEMPFLLRIWLGRTHEYMVLFSILTLAIILTQAFGGTLIFLIQATGIIRKFQIFTSLFNLLILPLSYLILKVYNLPVLPFIVIMVFRAIYVGYTLFYLHHDAGFPSMRYIRSVLIPELVVTIFGIVLPLSITSFMAEGILRCIIVFASTLIVNTFLIFYIGFNKHDRSKVLATVKSVVDRKIQRIKRT